MVSSIVPGATGAGALAVDPRLSRSAAPTPQQVREQAVQGDRVEVGGAAAWTAARESVREGLNQVQQALAAGHEAQAMLVQVQNLARSGGAQAELASLMQAYAERIEALSAQGAHVAIGEDVAVHAEPGSPPVVVHGVDLRLKDAPGADDLIQVARDASVDDADLAQAAQRSLENLQGAMEKLFNAARALEAHQGFLSAAEVAGAANADLDADGARLLALQVSQGLAGRGAIANVEPQAVLALFKA